MPQARLQADAIGLPVSREVVEAQIDALIDLLDQLDGDPDLEPSMAGYNDGMDDREGDDSDYEPDTDAEPSLAFSTGGQDPERYPQDGFGFHVNADAGRDLEDDHDGREPDVDGEASLGWTDNPNQASPHWQANHLGTVDLEQGIGAVRKKRPPSKTGGKVLRGCAELL